MEFLPSGISSDSTCFGDAAVRSERSPNAMHLKPTISPDDRQTLSDLPLQPWNYPGRELEFMDLAVNYHRWILERLRPYLGRRIVEVGAGTGAFSQLLL